MADKHEIITSWGNRVKISPDNYLRPHWMDQVCVDSPQLAVGLRRSYGDVCLLERGTMIDFSHIKRMKKFDQKSGELVIEAGISLKEIFEIIIPAGWMLPVVPGTQYVTVGGAIANDVHGKNHHQAGTFGCHVKELVLLKSDGQQYRCSLTENTELFRATIGGLGLTGMILQASVQLQPIASSQLVVEYLPFKGLDEFIALNQASNEDYAFTVAWLDCQMRGHAFSRGIYMRANYATDGSLVLSKKKAKSIPCYFSRHTLNKLSMKCFNQLYYLMQVHKKAIRYEDYQSFFFPLDSIQHWNRIYGKEGFYQYQFVLPFEEIAAIKKLLEVIVTSGQGSFLSVLKCFGDNVSPGMLSFPKPGVSLALDFPNKGKKTLELFQRMNDIVQLHQGRLYPAKDAQMPAALFQSGYHQVLEEFKPFVDPGFSSQFWQRVTE